MIGLVNPPQGKELAPPVRKLIAFALANAFWTSDFFGKKKSGK
jgi:hypothetical protein